MKKKFPDLYKEGAADKSLAKKAERHLVSQ